MNVLPNQQQKKATSYLQEQVDVILYYNNELSIDYWVYSIAVAKDNEFWLNFFPTRQEAEDYCKRHNLSIVKDHDAKSDGYI